MFAMLFCTTSCLVGQENTQRWDFECIAFVSVLSLHTKFTDFMILCRSHNLLNPSLTRSHIMAKQHNNGKPRAWIFCKCISFDILPEHSLIWSSFIYPHHSPFKAMNWGGTITFDPLLTFVTEGSMFECITVSSPQKELQYSLYTSSKPPVICSNLQCIT